MNSIFYGLLVLIAWVPLPLGSNRTWAWTIMVIACCVLAMAWLAGYLLGWCKITEGFRRARWALCAGALWLVYIGFQFASLPADWVLLLSPRAHEAHALVAAASGHPLAATLTLSIDPHATRDFWFKTIAYGCTFALALLLVDTRQRLELLLKTLVISGTLQALYASLIALDVLIVGT